MAFSRHLLSVRSYSRVTIRQAHSCLSQIKVITVAACDADHHAPRKQRSRFLPFQAAGSVRAVDVVDPQEPVRRHPDPLLVQRGIGSQRLSQDQSADVIGVGLLGWPSMSAATGVPAITTGTLGGGSTPGWRWLEGSSCNRERMPPDRRRTSLPSQGQVVWRWCHYAATSELSITRWLVLTTAQGAVPNYSGRQQE